MRGKSTGRKEQRAERKRMKVSSWILKFHQLHRMTSGQPKTKQNNTEKERKKEKGKERKTALSQDHKLLQT